VGGVVRIGVVLAVVALLGMLAASATVLDRSPGGMVHAVAYSPSGNGVTWPLGPNRSSVERAGISGQPPQES
jgi:hypothetical protein